MRTALVILYSVALPAKNSQPGIPEHRHAGSRSSTHAETQPRSFDRTRSQAYSSRAPASARRSNFPPGRWPRPAPARHFRFSFRGTIHERRGLQERSRRALRKSNSSRRKTHTPPLDRPIRRCSTRNFGRSPKPSRNREASLTDTGSRSNAASSRMRAFNTDTSPALAGRIESIWNSSSPIWSIQAQTSATDFTDFTDRAFLRRFSNPCKSVQIRGLLLLPTKSLSHPPPAV